MLEPIYGASSPSTERCNDEKCKEESTDKTKNNKLQLFHWKKKTPTTVTKKNNGANYSDIQQKPCLI